MPANRVTVYFATNRMPVTNDAGRIVNFNFNLGPVGGLNVRYGKAEVSIDFAHQKPAMVPGSLLVADETLFGPDGFTPKLGSNTIFDAIRADMAKGKPTIAFIHGFSNSFQDAIERAGWILAFYGLDANIFVFTWPSKGSIIAPTPIAYADYVHDRGTAAASGPAVARTIRRLYDYVDSLEREQRCDQPIHLICHSMGNHVMRNALQALMRLPDAAAAPSGDIPSMATLSASAPDPSRLRRSFDRIILAAADEDADAFDDPLKLKYLPRLGLSVTVYHTDRDWVLNTLSAITKFNGPRLGNGGPDNMATISDKVSAIDVSVVLSPGKDIENHQYYRVFPVVRDDIVAVLNGTPQDKIGNRTAVSPGRWRIKSARPAKRGRTARPAVPVA